MFDSIEADASACKLDRFDKLEGGLDDCVPEDVWMFVEKLGVTKDMRRFSDLTDSYILKK